MRNAVIALVVFANLLVVTAFFFFHWMVVREKPRRPNEPFRIDRLTCWTPEGRVELPIPEDAMSRDDRLRFFLECLDHDMVWIRVQAARILAYDLRYYPARHKIWEACKKAKDIEASGKLIYWFGLVATDEYVDEIVSWYHSEPADELRLQLIRALGRLKTKRARELLYEVAANSPNSKDAYMAAGVITGGWRPKAISVLKQYIERPDAKMGILGCPTLPDRLRRMQNRLAYVSISIIAAVLFPGFSYFLYLRLRRKEARFLLLVRPMIYEASLLLAFLGWFVYGMLTALGGGDAGAMNKSFLMRYTLFQCLLLLACYVVAVTCFARYFVFVRSFRHAPHPLRDGIVAAALFAVVFLNAFTIVNLPPLAWTR